MRLQQLFIEEKDALTELQAALKSGTATPIVARQSDEALLRFLTQYHKYRGAHWPYIVPFVVLLLLEVLIAYGNRMGWWKVQFIQFHLFFLPLIAVLTQRQQKKNELPREAWTPILVRLESASLPILLDVHRLRIAPLSEAVRTGLTKRLAVVSTDELESLTPIQRQELVRFTLAQVNPRKIEYYSGPPLQLSPERNQAAIVGFLALATLKQRGAEQITPKTISQSHVNLLRAIAEYKSALESS